MNKSKTNLGICMIFAHVPCCFKEFSYRREFLGHRTSLTIVIKGGIDETPYNIR